MRIGGGEAGGRRIGGRRRGQAGLRPTSSRVRLAIFSMLGPGGLDGVDVLDLYAGTGAMGFEALSRGARRAEFVELNERRCKDITEAAERLGFTDRVTVLRGRCERITATLTDRFDVVFIDPPYEDVPFAEVIGNLDNADALNPDATIFAEHSVRTELEDRYGRLERTDQRRYGDSAVSTYRISEAFEDDREVRSSTDRQDKQGT
ncbi:MAG: 16S rRNA (guanine(966)-N(2))-methyltransferase RsmD [Chloroflexi bacterium]|nr:16S rRNA (guanine(966)-N(2))-methyltransferase RsmD [Chloroflexota bacterium]